MIESLSLIDAVMPDVVESRKLAAAKQAQIRSEQTALNGAEDGMYSRDLYCGDLYSKDLKPE